MVGKYTYKQLKVINKYINWHIFSSHTPEKLYIFILFYVLSDFPQSSSLKEFKDVLFYQKNSKQNHISIYLFVS